MYYACFAFHIQFWTIKCHTYLTHHFNLWTETFRIHPTVPNLFRVCTKKYTVPNSQLTLNVGDKLLIPAYSIHHDPKYYPNPEVFDPERFTEENKASRPHGTFLPFGDGPRICIGKVRQDWALKLRVKFTLTATD